jgi:hypothetical protein
MRIFISNHLSEKIPLDVKASDTIGEVKTMIQKKVRTLDCYKLLLFLDGNFTA